MMMTSMMMMMMMIIIFSLNNTSAHFYSAVADPQGCESTPRFTRKHKNVHINSQKEYINMIV